MGHLPPRAKSTIIWGRLAIPGLAHSDIDAFPSRHAEVNVLRRVAWHIGRGEGVDPQAERANVIGGGRSRRFPRRGRSIGRGGSSARESAAPSAPERSGRLGADRGDRCFALRTASAFVVVGSAAAATPGILWMTEFPAVSGLVRGACPPLTAAYLSHLPPGKCRGVNRLQKSTLSVSVVSIGYRADRQ